MKSGMGKTKADKTIQYPRKTTTNADKMNLEMEQEVEMKYNGGTSRGLWHIFPNTHSQSYCLCSSKKRCDFSQNHMHKKRTVQDILDNPSEGFGRISEPGLNKLQRKVESA